MPENPSKLARIVYLMLKYHLIIHRSTNKPPLLASKSFLNKVFVTPVSLEGR